MKVVFASTPEQQEKITELINQVYSEIFPTYFSDDEIFALKEKHVLYLSGSQFEQLDTLKDAYQVIASLQTLIHILGSEVLDETYMERYYRNISILEEYGFSFPLEYKQFMQSKEEKDCELSIYTKVANDLLV
jgi:uncharacterized protein YifE (UPF0438 family)